MTSPGRDGGSATIWVATAVAALLALTGLGVHLGAAAVTRHRAEAAADLAALAGAGEALSGVDVACPRAREVATANRVRLLSCALDGWDALVEVAARPPEPLGALGEAVARARAGPAAP